MIEIRSAVCVISSLASRWIAFCSAVILMSPPAATRRIPALAGEQADGFSRAGEEAAAGGNAGVVAGGDCGVFAAGDVGGFGGGGLDAGGAGEDQVRLRQFGEDAFGCTAAGSRAVESWGAARTAAFSFDFVVLCLQRLRHRILIAAVLRLCLLGCIGQQRMLVLRCCQPRRTLGQFLGMTGGFRSGLCRDEHSSAGSQNAMPVRPKLKPC